ncbi:hornerin-like [Macrosteles quadrilineatus]|uniref:hornerin-like n=1 Tax=Macrosteles quadrilineatus TaxID=74068 RepID=UPI0023E15E0C|nr:hornerin-like [Macrosteles quadrilineatus]
MDGFVTNSPSNSPITNTNQVYGYKYSKNINNHPVTPQGMFYNNAVNPNWQWIQQNGNKTPDQAGRVQTGYTVQKSTGQEIGGTSPYFPYFTQSGESDHRSKGGISWFGGPAKFKDQTPATFNTQDRNYSIQQKTDTYIDGTSTQSKNEDDGKLTQSIGQESIDDYGYLSHVDSEGTGKLVDQGIQTPETHYSGNAGQTHGGTHTQNYVYDGTQFGGNKHQSVDQGTQTPETHYSGNAGQIHGGTHTQNYVYDGTQFGGNKHQSVDQGIQTPETHYSGNAGQIHIGTPTQYNVHGGTQFGEGTGKSVDQGIQTPETHYSGNAGQIRGGTHTQNYVYDGTQFGGNKHQSVDQGIQTPETHYSGNAGQIHIGTPTQYNVHGGTQFGEGTGKSVDQGIQTPETHYSGNVGEIHGVTHTQNYVHHGTQFGGNKHQSVDQGIQAPETHYSGNAGQIHRGTPTQYNVHGGTQFGEGTGKSVDQGIQTPETHYYTNIGKTGEILRGTPTQYNVHGGTQFGETTSQSVYGNIYGTKNEGSGTNYGYFKVHSTGHETKNVDTFSTNTEVINNVNNGESTVKVPASSVHPFDDKRGIQSPTFYEPSSAKLEYGYPSIPTIPNYGTTSLYGYDFPGSRYSSVQFSTVGRTNQQTKPSDFEEYRKSLQGGQDSTFGEEYNAGPNEGNSSPTGVLIEGGNSGVEYNEDGSVSRTGSYISTNKDGSAIDGGLSSSYPNNGNSQGQSDSAVDYLPAVKQSTIFSYPQNGDGSELVGSNSPSYDDNFTKVNRNTNDLKDGKIFSGKPKDDTPSSKKSYVSTSSFRGTNIFGAGQSEDRPQPSFSVADNSQKELSFDGKKSTTDQTPGTQYDGEGSLSTALGITGESGKEVSTFNRRKSNTSPDDGNKVVNVNGYSMTKRQLQDIIDSFKNVDKCVFTLPKVCSGPLDKYIHVINSYPDSASINDGFVRLPSDVIVPLPCYKSVASVYAKDSPLFSDKSGEVLPSGHFVKYTTSCNILASAKTPEKVSIVTPQGIVVPYDVHSKYMKSLSPKDKKKLKVLIPNEHKPISFGLYKEYLELYAPDSPAENKLKEGYIKLLRSKTKIPLKTFISILENYKNLKDATVTLPSGQSIPFLSYLKIAGLLGEEYNQKCVVNVPNTDTRVPYTVMEDVCNTYLGRKPNDLTKDTDVNFVFPRPRNPYAEELDYGKSSTFEDADAYSEYKYGEQYTYGGPYKYGERDYNRYDSHRPRSKYFLTEAADDVDPYSCCPSSADPPHSPASDRESILDVLHPGHTDLVGYCPHHRYCNRHKKSTNSASA